MNAAVKQAVARKAKKIIRTQKPTGTKTPARPKTPGSSKRKRGPDVKTLLNTILGPKSIKNGLLYLYESKLTTKEAIKNFTTKRNNNELLQTLKQQIEVIQQHQVPKISTNFNNGRSTRFNLNGDDKINLVYLIWLDAIHDKYISGNNLSFTNFMKSGMIELLGFKISNFKMTKLMYEVRKITEGKWFSYKVNNGKITDIEKTKTAKKGTISLGYEAVLKRNLKILFDFDSDIQEFGHDDIKFNKKPGEVVYIGIDQENSNQKSISEFVKKSKFTNSNNATWKQLQPYLTISNLTDPGIHMTMEGWGVDKVYLFPENKSKPPKSREAWNFRLQKFILGKTVITMKFDDVNNVYKTQINKETINTSASAGNAQKANNANIKVSKFFGDFLQALTMASYINEPIALGTGDGMMAVIYCFLRKQLLNREPKLVLDLSKGTKVQFIGLNNILQAKTSASEPTGVYINRGNNNMKNNASSYGSRTVSVSNVSNGNGSRTVSVSNVSNGNGTISGNSGNSTNTNMAQPLRKKQNTLTVASAIRNNKNNNNNNNNNNEVTSRSKKAKTTDARTKFIMGTNPKTKKKSFFPFPVLRKVTPTKPLLNQSINNARAELNKLTSLRQNQKNNYLEKMKQDPINILRILSNAKQVASRQRATRSRASAK
mgnify:CR=1 FL=1